MDKVEIYGRVLSGPTGSTLQFKATMKGVEAISCYINRGYFEMEPEEGWRKIFETRNKRKFREFMAWAHKTKTLEALESVMKHAWRNWIDGE